MPTPGDIVMVRFPFAEKLADSLHPALVLEVLGESRYVLAYGSSQRVDKSSPPANEVVVSDPVSLAACGLNRPTRFDLAIRAQMFATQRHVLGRLPATEMPKLYRAAVHCKLI